MFNPDQYTEPQQGLEPTRTFDELYELFAEWYHRRLPYSVLNKGYFRLWEEFKTAVRNGALYEV